MAPESIAVSFLIASASKLSRRLWRNARALVTGDPDTIIGKGHKQAIVLLTERKTRLILIANVERKTADQVATTTVRLLRPHAKKVHTLTANNGKQFARHREIAASLDADFYFAHPYASWERGTNKDMNGLIRKYFPKHRDFRTVKDEEIQQAMDRLNSQSRKCLGYRTLTRYSLTSQPLHLPVESADTLPG